MLDVGEDRGELNARATVSAKDDETATYIAQLVNGIIAFGHLAAQRDPDLQPLQSLARAVAVNSDGKEITIRFRFDTKDLLDHLEDIDD